MKKKTPILSQFFLIFILSGCLLGVPANPPAPVASSPVQPSSEFDAWAKGALPEIRINVGKETLTNYREQSRVQFTGKDEKGIPLAASLEYLVEVDQVRGARREVETIQTPDSYINGTNETVVVDGFMYSVRKGLNGDLVCEKEAIPADINQMVFHMDILQAIAPGKLMEQKVLVWGTVADGYDIKNVHITFGSDPKNIRGKVWIARAPTYFLKAEGTLDGNFRFDNRLANGNASFLYEVKDQNQVKIQVPTLCANPPFDLIPVPTNATEVDKSDAMLTFSSPENRDPIRLFYLNEFAARGWKVEALSPDSYPLALRASMTTPQAIRISAEVQINAMSDSSYVVITWRVQ
jgi:hypothetical protein